MRRSTPRELLAIVGPTASGKSTLALELARRVGRLEIVSVDSMQVYRGMDIGTAKPTKAEQAEVRHHLIDIVDPSEDYTVGAYVRDLAAARADMARRAVPAILVGGTGLYLRAAVGDLDLPGQFPTVREELEAEADTKMLYERLRQLDPLAATRMEPTNRRRVLRALEVTIGSGRPFSSFGPGLTTYQQLPLRVVGLGVERDELDRRIANRYRQMMAAGLLSEVRELARRPEGLSLTARQALGYRELLAHLRGELTEADAIESAITRTRRFARRQLRWYRRDPRIEWHDVTDRRRLGVLVDRLASELSPRSDHAGCR